MRILWIDMDVDMDMDTYNVVRAVLRDRFGEMLHRAIVILLRQLRVAQQLQLLRCFYLFRAHHFVEFVCGCRMYVRKSMRQWEVGYTATMVATRSYGKWFKGTKRGKIYAWVNL